MTFFDEKEEVINIELTSYGKYLLSKGAFAPEYYAFFDDDVIYDLSYAGSSEAQNDTKTRILETTQYTKNIVNRIGKDIASLELQEHKIDYSGEIVVPYNSENFIRALPLGTSDYNKQFAPSWDLKFLKGQISSSVYYTTNYERTNIVRVPQINLNSTIFYTSFSDSTPNSDNPLNVFQLENGAFIDVKDDHILFDLQEDNVKKLIENFDIELYMVDGDETSSPENHQQLTFLTKAPQILNGFLLDESEMPIEKEFNNVSLQFVQNYFDILVDDEIDTFLVKKQTTLQNVLSGTYASTFVGTVGEDC